VRDPAKAAKRREYRRLADYSIIGLVFPVAMILGFLAGRWIGGLFDQARLGSVVGGLFGIAAGFYNLYEMVLKLNREESGQGTDAGPPDDPR
jgi:hypothetical protein